MKPYCDAFIEHLLILFWFMPHGYVLALVKALFLFSWRKTLFRDPDLFVFFFLVLLDKVFF